MGLPTDAMGYLKQCKSISVPLYAYAGWCGFLGVRGKLPPEIQVIEIPDVMKLVAEVKRIIGGP